MAPPRTQRNSTRCAYLVAALFAFTLNGSALAQAPVLAPNRIIMPISESDVVTLAGNTHPLAQAEFDRGELAVDTRLDRLVLVLTAGTQAQQQLDALTEVQQQPSSPAFHHWLTPAQFGERFGVSAGDLAQVSAWLHAHGFTVEPASAGRRALVFSGTAVQIQDTFHTAMHRYMLNGVAHIANANDPQIPRALVPVVAGILSLHDFRRTSATRTVRRLPTPEYTQGSAHYLFPADFATIYNLKPLYAAGNNGSRQSIAIVGRSNISLSDVSSFRSAAGLAANVPAILLDGPDPGLIPGDQDEATLDVEWSGATAPGAAIKFVAAASTTTSDGVDLAALSIVNNKTAPVMSTSFGSCEANMGAAELAFYNSLWQQAASEGITALVSSGDSGAAGCDGGRAITGSRTGVNGLCSSPYSTCVGGTEFNEESGGSGIWWGTSNGAGGGSALSYIPEKVWNESGTGGGSGLWSSGGGISIAYPQPAWQAGVPGASSNGMRAVPDLSLAAASHDGYLVCLNGNWYVFAGTSASSPALAGIMAVVEQKLGGAAQGNANPTLYGLLNGATNPFHPTPTGNNTVPGVDGFVASGAAYNLSTGLGSVDANLLAANWPASGGSPAPGMTLTASIASLALHTAKTGSFTVTLTGTGGFSGKAALTMSTPPGVSGVFNPKILQAGAKSTVTLTVGSAAAPGSYKVTLTATSGDLVKTAIVSLTVSPAPTLSVSVAGVVKIAQGKSASVSVTTSTGGSFSGAVSMRVNGLPNGLTATWNPATFTASGFTTTKATLTLKAAATAVLTSTSLRITATGGGVTGQATCTLQVTKALKKVLHATTGNNSIEFTVSGQDSSQNSSQNSSSAAAGTRPVPSR